MNQVFPENDVPENDVIAEVKDGLGVITLNRPRALNALSLDMIRQVALLLSRWESDDAVERVLFCGAGGRAFCSGGDVKSFYHAGMEYRKGDIDHNVPRLFFREEYAMNRQIFHYPKPTMAFMDGITMGGGYGVAGHCRVRIATENTVFAMPEVGIGFFPDVGASYHLNKAPGGWGRYLALMGDSIGPGDMLAAGLADCYMDSARFDDLSQGTDVDDLREDSPKATLGPADIAVFEGDAIPDICKDAQKRSPLSVLVTDRHMRTLQGADFDTVIEADYARAQHFIRYPDLYAGIRSALISKDRAPQWEPACFADVQDADVERYFKPAPDVLCQINL